MSRDQHGGKIDDTKVGYKFSERVEEFRCLGTIVTNQNSIHEEIKNELKVGNAGRVFCLPVCYPKMFIHSVVCLTTGAKRLCKRVLHRVRYSVSSFSFQYTLVSLRFSNSCLHLIICLTFTLSYLQ